MQPTAQAVGTEVHHNQPLEEGGFGTFSDALGVGKVRVVGAAVHGHRDTPGY